MFPKRKTKKVEVENVNIDTVQVEQATVVQHEQGQLVERLTSIENKMASIEQELVDVRNKANEEND